MVSQQLKSQKCLSFFSSEMKNVVLTEAVKEMMFVINVLGSMKISGEYPCTLIVDNIHAIFIASNTITTFLSKHVISGTSM